MSYLPPNPATTTTPGIVQFGTTAGTVPQGNDTRIVGAEQTANKGVASGYAGLDATGKISAAQLPAAVTGGFHPAGAWNAATNTPALASGTTPPGGTGAVYLVSVAGTTTLDGVSVWNVADQVVYDGTRWDKIDGSPTQVTMVAGRTGVVTLAVADVSGALPSTGGTATGLILSADPTTALGAATKQYVDNHAAATPAYQRTNYTASGAISPADSMSLINSATAVAMTLAAGTVDNHEINVNAYGTGSVTVTAPIRGTSQTVTLSGAAGLPQNLVLQWLADQAQYTVK